MFPYVRYTKPPARMSGFTLIELMITVVIVAVLVSIALPSYASYIARARRADARTQLMQVAQFMQRFYAANDSFAKDRANNDVIDQVPPNLKLSPDVGNTMYELSLPLGAAPLTNAMSFTLRMVPVSGGAMANDECGAFTFTSAGVRGVIVGESVGSATLRDKCWK